MKKFAYIFHGGKKPESNEGMENMMIAWRQWMGDLNLVDTGGPFWMSSTVHADSSVTDDGGSNPASGYTIIEAIDKSGAIESAKSCPILESWGSVEVCEVMQM